MSSIYSVLNVEMVSWQLYVQIIFWIWLPFHLPSLRKILPGVFVAIIMYSVQLLYPLRARVDHLKLILLAWFSLSPCFFPPILCYFFFLFGQKKSPEKREPTLLSSISAYCGPHSSWVQYCNNILLSSFLLFFCVTPISSQLLAY